MLLHSVPGPAGHRRASPPTILLANVPIRSARRSEIDGPAELHARRDVAELASMEDRMLRDMGISRNEIVALVHGRGLPQSTRRR